RAATARAFVPRRGADVVQGRAPKQARYTQCRRYLARVQSRPACQRTLRPAMARPSVAGTPHHGSAAEGFGVGRTSVDGTGQAVPGSTTPGGATPFGSRVRDGASGLPANALPPEPAA